MLVCFIVKYTLMIDNFIALFPTFFQGLIAAIVNNLYLFLPIWLPIILLGVLWYCWIYYIKMKFLVNQEYVLLEIKLPNEIKKTPLAMELFLSALYQTIGEGTFIHRYIKGSTRPTFSLELISLEGDVKFFIWTRKFWKNLVEAQIYAQYPDIEISEVVDYTRFVKYNPESLSLWGCEYKLKKDDFYPIKTYVDYRLETEGIKEEEKTDPLSPILEFLGAVEQGQQVWFQILVRAHKKERKKKLKWKERFKKMEFSGKEDWRGQGQTEVEELVKKVMVDEGDPTKGYRIMTKGELSVVSAVERSISKLSFDCNIKAIYLAEPDKFDAINIMGLLGAFKQFNSLDLNQFGIKSTTSFDYPWQDYKNMRSNRRKRIIFNSFKRRVFSRLYSPFVLNTEELATIYHFPGGVIQTPTFSRLLSKKAEPPFNLPI